MNSVRTKQVQGCDTQNANWMISFGDLLTLLVCFFLVIVQNSLLHPQEVPPISEKNREVITKPTFSLNAGTTLAPNFREKESRTVLSETRVWEDGFVGRGTIPSTEFGAEIKAEVSRFKDSSARIDLEVCGSGPGWNQAHERALQLRRVVLLAGADPEKVFIRVVGNDCGGILVFAPTTQLVSGVVRLSQAGELNG